MFPRPRIRKDSNGFYGGKGSDFTPLPQKMTRLGEGVRACTLSQLPPQVSICLLRSKERNRIRFWASGVPGKTEKSKTQALSLKPTLPTNGQNTQLLYFQGILDGEAGGCQGLAQVRAVKPVLFRVADQAPEQKIQVELRVKFL